MKKRIVVWSLLFCILASVCAAESGALPPSVVQLCAQAHPGYAIAAYDGWGDETAGQLAMILTRDGDNVLCIAEKEADDPAYMLTVDNTDAVYDGDVLPSLLIDTGGDSLFYTYPDEYDGSLHVHAVRTDGRWGAVDTMLYRQSDEGYSSIGSFFSGEALLYQQTDEDEHGNILKEHSYAPVYLHAENRSAFAKSMELGNFSIGAFDADPADGLYRLTENPAFAQGRGNPGDALLDLDISQTHMAELYENARGDRYLGVSDWDGTQLVPVQVLGLRSGAYMDTYHADSGEVFITNGEMMYSVLRADAGSWYLTGVGSDGVRRIGPDYAAPDGTSVVFRNDGYVYGDSPWDDFLPGRIDLPSSFEEAYAQLDQSAYALVNNPDPADRLHLRGAPDKGAYSYGKFYNRTPVRVLRRGETWTKVQIGAEGKCFTGFMMTRYLAFDEEEKAAVSCAFPQKHIREAYRKEGLRLLCGPAPGSDDHGAFCGDADDFIIGVKDDEWYVVLRADGAVGYVLQSAFWDGNG